MGYRRGPDAAFRGQQAVASPLNQTVLSRAITDLNLAGEYAEAMLLGAQFPPAVVFGEAAGEYWLADGYHRWHAATIAGLQTIACDVRPGGRREAILHSVGANAEHGWRRSTEDKRRAVRTLLNDAEWCQWSDREIGRRCGVDHKTVAPLRPAPLSGEGDAGVEDAIAEKGGLSGHVIGSGRARGGTGGAWRRDAQGMAPGGGVWPPGVVWRGYCSRKARPKLSRSGCVM
jgi:hypothetical protein